MIVPPAAGHNGVVSEVSAADVSPERPPARGPSGSWGEPGPGDARAGPGSVRPPGRAPPAELRLRVMIDTHFDFIWRSLRRFGVSPVDVDDCAQQVFIIASQKLDAIAAGRERAFLFGTAVRVASDARRTRTRRREVPLEAGGGTEAPDDEAAHAADPGLTPEQATEHRRARALLDEVLAQMPMDLRAVFVLFELEEVPTQQIAELLGILVGTAASRLRRAREEYQKLVARVAARTRGGKP